MLRAILGLGLILSASSASAEGSHAEGTMHTGALTSQPIGHYEFCRASPEDCGIRTDSPEPAVLTGALWETLESVNAEVNIRVAPKTDQDHYGRDEVWTYPDDEGDCEDYALEKRRLLMARGFPASDLLMTVLRKPDGEGHAVLTIRTDGGDFVLDNLSPDVKLWADTPYTFVKRQSEYDSGRWVSIAPHRETAVGSVR